MDATRLRSWVVSVVRVIAGALGALCIWNVLRACWSGADLNVWWIDLRVLAWPLRAVGLGGGGLVLLAWAVWPTLPRVNGDRHGFRSNSNGNIAKAEPVPIYASTDARRAEPVPISVRLRFVLTLITVVGFGLTSLANAIVYWTILGGERLYSGPVIPSSLFVTVAMAAILWAVTRRERAKFSWPCGAVTLVLCAGAIPLAHMMTFGLTDYRRPADAAVVFGAGVFPNGGMTDALSDRMHTAVELYHQGIIKRLVVSGGPGPGQVHETAAMRQFAIAQGVPADSIIVDEGGLNTRETVRNTAEIFSRYGMRTVLAVSHFYHMPRVKLAYQQAGWDVFTVPSPQQRPLAALPYYMARECAVLWTYYLGA